MMRNIFTLLLVLILAGAGYAQKTTGNIIQLNNQGTTQATRAGGIIRFDTGTGMTATWNAAQSKWTLFSNAATGAFTPVAVGGSDTSTVITYTTAATNATDVVVTCVKDSDGTVVTPSVIAKTTTGATLTWSPNAGAALHCGGVVGLAGQAGPAGSTGAKGDKGDTGAAGPQGPGGLPTIPTVASDPNILGTTCTPPYMVQDLSTGFYWICVDTDVFQMLPSTYGSGPYTLSAYAATPTRDVAANRPSPCVTNSLYIATDTNVMSQCSSASGSWTTLNPTGYIAMWFDTSTHSIHTFDEDGIENTGSGGGSSGVGRTSVNISYGAIADMTCLAGTATWMGITTSDLVVAVPVTLASGLVASQALVKNADSFEVDLCNFSGSPITPGSVSFNAVLALYTTTGSGSINLGAIPMLTCKSGTFTLAGAVAGDTIVGGYPSTLEAGLVPMKMFVSDAATITATVCNFGDASITSGAKTYKAQIAK